MRILWLNWKDLTHPQAGGAEVVTEELISRLAKDGHEVTLLTAGYPGAEPRTVKNGYTIIRVGNRFSVYWHAYRYYKKNMAGTVDLVIDEVNTIPFFAALYVKEPVVNFFHQLAREIWFYEMPLPFSFIGYIFEPLYLRPLRKMPTITVSESSKQDLIRHGFRNIFVISEGIKVTPLQNLQSIKKHGPPTMLAFGAIRSMKRTHHIIKAFEHAKRNIPELRLIVAGASFGAYGRSVLKLIELSPYREDIQYEGEVDTIKKMEFMQTAWVLVVTSIKEGWGLVVTEAASQGTPAVVYNVDGLRDSVKHDLTGLTTSESTPEALAAAVVSLLNDETKYNRLRQNAWEWSKDITFEKSYTDFCSILQNNSYESTL